MEPASQPDATPAAGSGARFVVATPIRSVCDDNARVLHQLGRLRFLALGTRRGTAGVPPGQTRLKPVIGLLAYAATRIMNPFRAESFRFGLLPWFDRWVLRQLQAGDHILSSYGYTNECFKFVRRHGGKTFLDAGNSHIENFWEVLSEEHRRWNCPTPPVSPQWYARARAMLPEVEYVLSPSAYVTRSFLARGFRPEQILRNVYPVDLSVFQPPVMPRPKDRPPTIICTGSLSLRKGTPYLLEAFRLIRQRHPTARLLLMQIVQDDIKPVLARYKDLPIDWSPGLPHALLAERLRSADVFALPSLEDGFARTVTEALACGLPVVTTPNTGASDLIEPGKNGTVVPIRAPQALADALMEWLDKVMAPEWQPRRLLDSEKLSFDHFAREFQEQLAQHHLLR